MDTRTKIAGVELDSYILNASGVRDTTLKELKAVAKSDSSAIVMKSCTIEPRKGNLEPRYMGVPFGSIQSMGLPNLGCREYIRFSSKLKKYGKPIIASVAGFCVDDYRTIVSAFQDSDVDLIEVNLSCPNLEGRTLAYDFEQTAEILRAISDLGNKPYGLKLPPYCDSAHRTQVAELIEKYGVSFITLINSIGTSLIIDPETEKPVIRPKGGLGGLCGSYIKPIALGNVRAFYKLLKNKVSIFGVGGIESGTDAFEFLLAGADAVQVATTFEKQGPSCFGRINKELTKILKRKRYNSIQGVKGALKEL